MVNGLLKMAGNANRSAAVYVAILGLIFKTSTYMNKDVFLQLFKSLAR